jgi:hypothetical protein
MNDCPKVLLLGDSIRMSYQNLVAQALEDVAEVVAPEENCQYSLYTLSSLHRWLNRFGTPDIVHWNNGLHDCGHNPRRSPVQIPLEMYVANLGFTLEILQETKAEIIWATTTPVHPQRPFNTEQWSWRNEEIDAYNRAARELFESKGIPANDLHAVVAADYDRYLAGDQLHLSEAGQQACAEAVANAICRYLPDPGEEPI